MKTTLVVLALLSGTPRLCTAEERKPVEEALQLLQQAAVSVPSSLAPAAVEDSQEASVHLNVASLLFYKGRHLFREDSTRTEGQEVFQDVQRELLLAIRFAAQDPDERRRNLVLGQAAYLLGDVVNYVLQQPGQAKAFYQQALRFVPEHLVASETLKRLP